MQSFANRQTAAFVQVFSELSRIQTVCTCLYLCDWQNFLLIAFEPVVAAVALETDVG